jgi:hypothetical protein
LAALGGLEAFGKSKPSATTTPPAPITAPPSADIEREFLRSLQTPPKPTAKAPSKAAEEPPALGIVGQIEEALQKWLTGRPDMLPRNIHVRSAPDGSLRVQVDGRFYHGIDEVPDPAVRELLQAVIKDWESKI